MSELKIKTKNLKYRENSGQVYFTVEDLEFFPEWPESDLIELINGELFVVPSPNLQHQRISSKIEFIIQKYLEKNPIGEIFHAPIDVELSSEDLVSPDIVFVQVNRRFILKEKKIIGSPDLIIEITSSNKQRDLVKKKHLYEQFLIKEYIIVNPEDNYVLIYLLQNNNRYNQGMEYKIDKKFPINSIDNLLIETKDIL